MTENKTFEKLDFALNKLDDIEFEECTFNNCVFDNHSISNVIFRECEFHECNFGSAILKNTVFNDTQFVNCKMIGLDFSICSTLFLSMSFSGCNLNFSSFYLMPLKGIVFKNCSLESVDFTETDLTSATFDTSNLKETTFEHTILEHSDFRTAQNYQIDPQKNKLKKTKFSSEGLKGLLSNYDIIIE